MKAMKKLIPALAMLLVSAVVMSSASFTWFTMSRQVTAQGMNVTVTAPNNLLIKLASEEDEVANYAEIKTINGNAIKLVPASTKSGKSTEIYSVKDGEALDTTDGSLFMTDTDGKQTKLEPADLAVDGGAEGGYYDFKYTLKTEGSTSVDVVVKSITVTNNATGKSVEPVRVAVMPEDQSKIKMYNPVNGRNLDNKVVKELTGEVPTLDADTNIYVDKISTSTPEANKTVTVYANNTNGSDRKFVTLASNTPTNIIVRVWYEGQDEKCVVSTGANAKFDVELVLADVNALS